MRKIARLRFLTQHTRGNMVGKLERERMAQGNLFTPQTTNPVNEQAGYATYVTAVAQKQLRAEVERTCRQLSDQDTKLLEISTSLQEMADQQKQRIEETQQALKELKE